MKKLSHSRKAILRAIHAACVALFLLASQRETQAQVAYTVPFTGSGTTYSATAAGSYSGAYGFSASGSGYSLTISSGVSVTNTSSSGYTGAGTIASPYATVTIGGGTVTNHGSISAAPSSTSSYGAALTLGSAGSATVNNYGSLSGTYPGVNSADLIGVDFNSTNAYSLTLTNNSGAVISGSAPGTSYGIFANTTSSGTISIANSGTISGMTNSNGGYGIGISGATTLGQITVTNSGTGSITGVGQYRGIGIDVSSNSGNISITNENSATVSAQTLGSDSAYYGIGIRAVTTSGAITINNTSSVSGSGYGPGFGIQAVVTGAGTVNITNAGTIQGISTGTIGGAGFGIGVNTSGSGAVTVNNSGSVSASGYGTSSGISVSSSGTGSITVNSSTGTITASSVGSSANDIAVTGSVSNDVTVSNSSALSVTAQGTGSGIYANLTAGNIAVTNSGAISPGGGGNGVGINIFTGAGNVSVTNASGGTISASGEGEAGGIFAVTSNGTMQVTNAAALTLGVNGGGSATGIEAEGTSTSVTNSGSISVNDTGFDNAYALFVTATSGPLTIHNSGSLTATASSYQSYGIYLGNPGTVVDSGNITAGTYAIYTQDGSTVTLEGRPIISGTIQGNGTSTTTSQLVFNLSIPAANLAAARAELNTEIAAYDMQLGGAYTFTVDGLTYDVSNFDFDGGVIDDLMAAAAARLYRNTPGFYNEGLVLDTLPSANAVAARLLAALNNVPDAGVPAALAELSPKELEVFRNVAFYNNTFNDEQINNHLANLRDGLTGFDSSALTVQDSSMDPTLNQVRDHLLAYNPAATPGLISDSADSVLGAFDAKDMKSAQVNTQPVDRWSTFIAGNVILADLSNNLNVPDSNYTTGNVSAGLDYRLDDHFTVGALFAYAHTDADLDARNSSATVDSYSPGIYASYVDKGWYGNFLGAYTRNAYTEDREIDITGLNGDNHGATSGNQGSANLTGGYEFQKGPFKFGPVASLQYVHLAIDSIQEQGPTALDINDQNQDSLRSLLGFEGRFNANVATPIGPVSLTPHVSVSWQHEYLDNSGGITSQFDGAGGGSFFTQTDSPDRDSAFVDVGLDATLSKNVTVFVDYEAQAGQSNFFAQSAQGGIKIGF
jgi:outer membrane autotransporter protein